MKKHALILLSAVWATPGLANECLSRAIQFANPVFPKTLDEIKTLQREGSCTIDIAYSINGDGRAENIEYYAARPACRIFNIPAIRAIRGSAFSKGDYVPLCYIKVVFELREGRVSWGYY